MANRENKISEELAKVLRDLIEQQKLERKGIQEDQKREKKSMGGLMDNPFYYNNSKSIPGIIENISRVRAGYKNGGAVDENSAEYLLSVLEGGAGLSLKEIEAMEALLKDLKRDEK